MEWVRDHIADAEAEGAVPLIAVMRHQRRRDAAVTTTAAVPARTRPRASGIAPSPHTVGSHRVVIAFEPDSLGTIDCLGPQWRQNRLDLLRYGVDVLSRSRTPRSTSRPGASDWEPAHRTAEQLRYIGIHKVRGFMLNVTHYDWTPPTSATGSKISRAPAASRSSSTPPPTAAARCTGETRAGA